MSKIALTPNASGTGTLTIAAPNTSTDRTLTLPDSTGTIDTLGRAGNVLQVVSGQYATQSVTTSGTFSDTGLTASITPSSTSSKILVMSTINGTLTTGGGGGMGMGLRLMREGSEIQYIENLICYSGTSDSDGAGSSVTYKLDSPASTSSLTYKIQYNSRAPTASAYICFSNCVSTMILMEIAA